MTKNNLFEHYTSEEDNVTKALITVLKESENFIQRRFFKKIGLTSINTNNLKFELVQTKSSKELQERRKEKTIPDAWITGNDFVICVENKIQEAEQYKKQILGHLDQLSRLSYRKKFLLGLAKTKEYATALEDKQVRRTAKKNSVKLIFAGWHEEITKFVLDELRYIKPAQKAYMLLNNFKEYLGDINMLKIEGFNKKDLDSLNEKHSINERKALIKKNVIPKLKIIRDMLEPIFRSHNLPHKGYLSQFQWRGRADEVWIGFHDKGASKGQKKSQIIHYSFVVNDKSVYLLLHLRPGRNLTNFLKEIKKDNAKMFLKLLQAIGKENSSFEIQTYDGNNEASETLYDINSKKLAFVLDLLQAYPTDAKMNIIRNFNWDTKSERNVMANGNKLLNELYDYIKLVKPIYGYIHSFAK
jgi:hypothetical protein